MNMHKSEQNLLSIPFTIHELIDKTARYFPNKVFVSDDDETLTYDHFKDIGGRIAHNFASSGFEFQDRLLIAFSNSVVTPLCLYAMSMLGGILIPVSNKLRGERLSFLLNDCKPMAIITDDKNFLERSRAEGIENIFLHENSTCFIKHAYKQSSRIHLNSNVIDLDLVALMYTSGSTGKPKAIALSHSNIMSSVEAICRYLEMDSSDRILNFIPFHFDYGFYQILLAAGRGATLFIKQGFIFKNEIFKLIKTVEITGIPFVPSQITSMYRRNKMGSVMFPSVQFITNTGAAFPDNYLSNLRNSFPNAKIYKMYGLTECKRVSYLNPNEIDRKPLSVGKPIPNSRAHIIDNELNKVPNGSVGQLVVEGRNVMVGYWNNVAETQNVLMRKNYLSHNQLLTGDYFCADNEGYLYFKGRRDDIIKCGSLRVSTLDIEDILMNNPTVSEVAVVPIKDELLGESSCAFVVAKQGLTTSSKELLSYFAKQVESPNMIPREVLICNELPKTENGKINYKVLKECPLFPAAQNQLRGASK